MDVDFIVKAGELITCTKEFSIKNGAIACSRGRIVDVGKASLLRRIHRGEFLDFSGNTILPGFIDSHTHLIWDGTREEEFVMKLQGKSYLEIQRAGGGIYYTVDKTRKASREKLKQNALKTLDRMLICGTTTIEAKSGYGLDGRTEMKSLDVIKNLRHPVELHPTYLAHVIPKEFSGKEDSYIDSVRVLLAKIKKEKLAKFVDVFCDEGAFTKDQTREILTEAKTHGFKLKMHADEFSSGGAEVAGELGCISAEHLLRTTERGMEALARNNVVACLLPGTPFILGTAHANARLMLQKGITVALATDFNPNCLCENIQLVMSLACVGMKMTPQEAIMASTVGGAKALGLNDVGTLERGKKADFIIADIPSHTHIGYHFGVNLVTHVFKKGKLVVEEGKVKR
jgi:imidazolonepropionase